MRSKCIFGNNFLRNKFHIGKFVKCLKHPTGAGRFAECHFAKCRFAECCFAECRFAEWVISPNGSFRRIDQFFYFYSSFQREQFFIVFFFMMLMMMLCFIFSKSTSLNGFSSMRFCFLFNMSSSLKKSRFLNF